MDTTCRSRQLGTMPINEQVSGLKGLPLQPTDGSLIVHNPSAAVVLLRWGTDAVDPHDNKGGYDVVLPGLSYSTVPIPTDASALSADWVYSGVGGSLQPVPMDVSGKDFVTLEVSPLNLGAACSPLDLSGGWVKAAHSIIGRLTDGTSPNAKANAWQAANLVTFTSPTLVVSIDCIAALSGSLSPIGAVWNPGSGMPGTVLGSGSPAALVDGWYESAMNLMVPAGTFYIGVLAAAHTSLNLGVIAGQTVAVCDAVGATSPVTWDVASDSTLSGYQWPIRAQILAAV